MQFEIFLVSASYVSERKFQELAQTLMAANPIASTVVRLEHHGITLFDALDAALVDGATHITLRPIGLPFSQSLKEWVPNAAADWLARQVSNIVKLAIANDLQGDHDLIAALVQRRQKTKAIPPKIDGLNGKGWDAPPAFEHHLLVCTGPRCHMRGSFGLLTPLKAEIERAGIRKKCLIASTCCLFPCNNGPVLIHYPHGHWYQLNSADDVAQFVRQVLVEHKSCDLRLPYAATSPSSSQAAHNAIGAAHIKEPS